MSDTTMNSLTNAALEALTKKVLPELQSHLEVLAMTPAEERTASAELQFTIKEAHELMGMLRQWSQPDEQEGMLSDQEAKALLQQQTGATKPAAPAGDMSDDEAAAMLAAMDEPAAPAGDMSDDEAATALAAMDAPAPPAGDMSDDEAAAALAAMDEPAAPAGDMSDDEAAAMLAAMDEPTSASAPTPEPEAPPAPVSAEEEVTEIDEWEANDFQTDPDMVNDFNANSDELMETLDETILRLEQDPKNKEIIEEIFRAAHTLKGAAGMFGFKGLERVMHRMENLFDLIRKDKLNADSNIVDLCFKGLDVIRVLLEAVKNGKPCGTKTAPIVHALSQAAIGKAVSIASGTPDAETKGTGGEAAEGNSAGPTDEAPKKDKKAAAKKEVSTIRVDLDRLDALVNLVGELVIDRTRFVSIEEELRTNHPRIKLSGNMSETVQLFGRHMNDVQDIIMKVRMVPIGNAFNKFTRIVRDLARTLDKKIELAISGEDAELDKTLVEQIGDPLIHLIRNSCDHGIEMPADRVEKGKPEQGTIHLSAQQEGNLIVIRIQDDGKGIPVDIIRKKGIEKGLISEKDKLTDRDIFNLIFEPGFSSAEKVSNISGRGVGMDVVKRQIMKLKGMLEVDSAQGKGTTITIRLPLTLAIVQSLLIGVQGEVFAIPLGSVIESIRIVPTEIQRVGEQEVIKLRDKVLPLMHLNDVLRLERKEGTIAHHISQKKSAGIQARKTLSNKEKKIFVVVVGQPDRPFGIVVDQLLNQQEMVIKSMGKLMKRVPFVAGGAVLGNGEVVLVLDIPELEESFSVKKRTQAA